MMPNKKPRTTKISVLFDFDNERLFGTLICEPAKAAALLRAMKKGIKFGFSAGYIQKRNITELLHFSVTAPPSVRINKET